MRVSLNDQARSLVHQLTDDAETLRVAVGLLPSGATVIDCGSQVPGGLEAGRRFAEICMGGLGTLTFTPLVLGGRWMPGIVVTTYRPAAACEGSPFAGRKPHRV